MRLPTGWVVCAGVIFSAATANAQLLAPREVGAGSATRISDFYGPGAAMPQEMPVPQYDPEPQYGPVPQYEPAPRYEPVPRYAPAWLPPNEVYAIVRESGFSPLGAPRQRGRVYTIAVIDRNGEDGRLIIDARSGRIIRFVPAGRMAEDYDDDQSSAYDWGGPMPQPTLVRGVPRPPAPIPHVASRTSRVSKSTSLASRPASGPAPQQSAAIQPKTAEIQSPAPIPTPAVTEAKPAAPPILPTREMPKVLGLE